MRREFDGGCFQEPLCLLIMPHQRFDFPAQSLVPAAGLIQEGGPLALLPADDFVIKL